jgi:hypothetical protein
MVFWGRLIIMLALSVLSALTLSQSAVAEIFKCEIEGKLVLQDIECPTGVEQSIVDVVIQNDKPKYNPFERERYDES